MRGSLWRLLLAVLVPGWLVCSSARADNAVHVHVASDACPSATQLRDVLMPLLGGETPLRFDPPESSVIPRVRVIDQGTRYSVTIDDRTREIEDTARDCTERARVASVFIALNLHAHALSATTPEPPAPTEPAESAADVWPVGLFVFGSAAYTNDIASLAPGGGLGASLRVSPLVFQLSAGVFAPVDITLQPTGDTRGSVEMWRLPLVVSASYLWRAGGLEAGPTLGLELDALWMRGNNVDRPQTETRLNPALLAAIDARVRLTDAWFVLARLGASLFPRAYQLRVEPTGALGQTPQVGWSANLGLEARLH